MRLQLALNVPDLEAAVNFYAKMFGVPVNKRKPGYANFSVSEPPLKLVLFEVPGAEDSINHLGVEVFDDGDIAQIADRANETGLATKVEDETTCCYAKQDKVWLESPDGKKWEWYKILEDSETFFETPVEEPAPARCC
jgi:catechol 2,3-dioxygenase-like lactoylglutathione lyase family enzyme